MAGPVAEAKSPDASPCRTAMVTFLTGDVRASVAGSARAVELGSDLATETTVTTGKDSRCDLQFGSLGTLRIQPESSVTLRDISVDELRRVASTRLEAGSVAAKVSKLAATDRFDVSTSAAVFGVRGTEFVVRAEASGKAKVSVKEGSVAILPPSFDPARLEADTKGKAEVSALGAVFSLALEKAPKVEAAQEARVGASELAGAAKAWDRVAAGVVEAAAKASPSAPVLAEDPAVKDALSALASAAAPLGRNSKRAGLDSAEAFSTFASMPISEGSASLVPVMIDCLPADASITVDGVDGGIGSVSLLRPSGSRITIRVRRDGYEDQELELVPSSAQGERRSIELKAKAAPAPQGGATPSPNAAAAAPASARVPASPLVARIQAGAGKPVGSCVATPDGALFADERGVVYRVSTKALLWKAETGNALAACAAPEVAQGVVYLEGDKNLTLISLAKGATLSAVPLDAEASGLFGRRPAVVGGELFLSSSEGLRVLDSATGKPLRSIALPEGSDMSPRACGKSILLADRTGRFYKIDPTDGKPAFAVQSKAFQPVALASAVSGSRAFFADRKGVVTAVDLGSGAVLWSKRADEGGKAIFDDLVVADGAVWAYFKGRVSALSAETGECLMPALGGVAAPPFAAAGYVWVPMLGGRLAAYEGATGVAARSLSIDGEFAARPAEAEGLFLCPLASGEVAVIDPAAAK